MKISKQIPLIITIVLLPFFLSSQVGGRSDYMFLQLPTSPRISAMGGNFLSIYDGDINLALSNPSLINNSMHRKLSLNHTGHKAKTSHSFASFGYDFEKVGSFVGSVMYINYGKFDGYDEYGEPTNPFRASDWGFNIGWGRMLDSVWSIGANLKTISSSYETYKSVGIAVDVAGSYAPNPTFSSSLIFRNIGAALKNYSYYHKPTFPFEIQLAFSKKLAHTPFRYSVLLQHLQKWDLTVPEKLEMDPFTGEVRGKSKFADFSDKLFRHVVIGGEFMPSKNFSVRIGYNYHRRQELKSEFRAGMSGFSFGAGFRVSRFQFNYAYAAYHLVAAQNYFNLTVDIN